MEKEINCSICENSFSITHKVYDEEPAYCVFCGSPLLDEDDLDELFDEDMD